jgi:hypothetical protein
MNYRPILNEQRQERLMTEAQELVDHLPGSLSELQAMDGSEVSAILEQMKTVRIYFLSLRYDLTPENQHFPGARQCREALDKLEHSRQEWIMDENEH